MEKTALCYPSVIRIRRNRRVPRHVSRATWMVLKLASSIGPRQRAPRLRRTMAYMLKRSITIAFLAASLAGFAPAADTAARSAKARAEFKRLHHCPATDRSRGACPGYVIDHVVPLCAGGADRPSNMQWQTISEGKAKDRIERQECRRQSGNRDGPSTKRKDDQ